MSTALNLLPIYEDMNHDEYPHLFGKLLPAILSSVEADVQLDVLEIGTLAGHVQEHLHRSLVSFQGPQGPRRIIGVDWFKDTTSYDYELPRLFKRIYSLGGLPYILGMDSKAALRFLEGTRLAFLFIDGDHSYEGALTDIQNFVPLVVPDGLVCIHDENIVHVRRAIDESADLFSDSCVWRSSPPNEYLTMWSGVVR